MTSILFIGDLNKYSRSYQRFRVLHDLDYEVRGVSLHPIGDVRGVSQKPSLFTRLRHRLGYPADLNGANKRIMAQISNGYCPDLVWIESGKTLFPSTLRFIKQHCPGAKIVFYSNDNLSKRHNRSCYSVANIELVDVIFIVKGYSAETVLQYGAKQVVFFHRAYDKNSIWARPPELDFTYDVVFIGTFERERYRFLDYLAAKGVSVTVFGNNWPATAHSRLCIQYKPVFLDEFVHTMHSSKIVLNFLRKINEDITTGRTFEIPASGSFMLAERTEEQKQYFTEGEEADFFGSPGELVEKARYYLTHSEDRARIARNGLHRCQESHYSYHDRLREMLDAIDL